MQTITDLSGDVRAAIKSIVGRWKARYDSRDFDYLNVFASDPKSEDGFRLVKRHRKVRRGTQLWEDNDRMVSNPQCWLDHYTGGQAWIGAVVRETFGIGICCEVEALLYRHLDYGDGFDIDDETHRAVDDLLCGFDADAFL